MEMNRYLPEILPAMDNHRQLSTTPTGFRKGTTTTTTMAGQKRDHNTMMLHAFSNTGSKSDPNSPNTNTHNRLSPTNAVKKARTVAPSIGTTSTTSTASTASTAHKVNSPDPALWNIILSMPIHTTQRLLYQICIQSSIAASVVRSAHSARLKEVASRPPISFESYAKECWYTINMKYKRLSTTKQTDVMGDIIAVLSDSRESIMKEASPNAKYETRRNALEALRRICKSIMLCDETQIRHELMKDSVELGDFAAAMTTIAARMTEAERGRYKKEGMYEKLEELQRYCDWETDMEGLADLLAVFERDGDRGRGGDEATRGVDGLSAGRSASAERSASSESTSSFSSPKTPKPVEAAPPQRTKVFSVMELS